jgi:hypothetical protein
MMKPLIHFRRLRTTTICWLCLFGAVALTTPLSAAAGECSAPEHHQFDFWIGDWTIKQKILKADGSWFEGDATTKVSPILSGCGLMEEWKGDVLFFWEGMKEPAPLQGFSVRAFDPKTKLWVISWMDTRNPRFGEFVGNFKDGRGEFFKKSPTENGKRSIARITFSDITQRSVHWDLAVSSDEDKTWRTLWVMEMTRPTPAP